MSCHSNEKKITNTETDSPVPGNFPPRVSEPPDPRKAQDGAEGRRQQVQVGKDSGVRSNILAVGNRRLWEGLNTDGETEAGSGLKSAQKLVVRPDGGSGHGL